MRYSSEKWCIIIFHLSKLWKAKFFITSFILCDVIFLVRAAMRKFEIDHSWEWKGSPNLVRTWSGVCLPYAGWISHTALFHVTLSNGRASNGDEAVCRRQAQKKIKNNNKRSRNSQSIFSRHHALVIVALNWCRFIFVLLTSAHGGRRRNKTKQKDERKEKRPITRKCQHKVLAVIFVMTVHKYKNILERTHELNISHKISTSWGNGRL